MLHQKNVLIVEDEAFTALELAASVEDEGGIVIGPAASVREALRFISGNEIHAAILDVHLTDRDVGPVADLLLDRCVAVVIHSGLGATREMVERHPELTVYYKPTDPRIIMTKLAALMSSAQQEKIGPSEPSFPGDIEGSKEPETPVEPVPGLGKS